MKGWVVLLAALLAGCAGNETRRQVLADPATPPAIRQAIEQEKIRVGMTKQQVIAAWGPPCGYCYGTRESSWGDTWEYNVFGTTSSGIGRGTYLYFDRTGTLTGWSD